MSKQETPLKQSFAQKSGLFLKISLIVCLTLLMLIPASIVQGLISDRIETKTEIISEIGEKRRKEQTTVGPVLALPSSTSKFTGSLGLFLIPGFVMYLSRKIDWYKLNPEVKL